MLEDRGDETQVTVLTTLNVTGKPAQFGRGVMNEVGGRLLNIFATNLAATLAEEPEPEPDQPEPEPASRSGAERGGWPGGCGANGAGPATTQAAGGDDGPAGERATGRQHDAGASGARRRARRRRPQRPPRRAPTTSIDELRLPRGRRAACTRTAS